MKKLLAEVERQAGKPFRFLELRASQAYFEVQVQDPLKPENADSYQRRSDTPLRKVPLRTSGASAEVLTQSILSTLRCLNQTQAIWAKVAAMATPVAT